MINEPATKGDVIVIVLLMTASVIGLALCPYVYGMVGDFDKMFKSLGADLPAMTKLVMRFGLIIGYVLAPGIVVGAWLGYAKSGDMSVKIGISVASVLGTGICLYIAVVGILHPILELEKQLS
ncbi:MAG: hypothetical protein PF961_21730 [Planctomycetota bacterium]|jgi:hypothetical protein|nr:hypothetical protein [Planctomycetota bacterium]